MNKSEAPNDPRYVRNKRGFKFYQKITSTIANGIGDDNELIDKNNVNEEHTCQIVINSKKKKHQKKNKNEKPLIKFERLDKHDEFIYHLRTRIPKWGGFINFNEKRVQLTDTCTIDYFLLSLWILSKIVPDFRLNLSIYELSDSLIRIVDSIENINWKKAKEIWIIEVMKY